LMRKTKELLSFTANNRRAAALLSSAFLLGIVLWTAGCGIKQTIKVSPGIRNARTAGFEDLIEVIRGYDGITGLSCSDMELTFTSSRKREIGELEKYRSLHGYILLRRPDSTHFVLLMPVTKSTFLDVLSVGDNLSVWYPRKNEFYQGRNSQKEFVVEDASGAREFTIPVRGTHIFEAIFPQSVALDTPGVWVIDEEQTDSQASYYVLSFVKEEKAPRMRTLRKIWIERAGLTIARQQVYGGEGAVLSDIIYSEGVKTEGFVMPHSIHIERPEDGYILDLKFEKWSINPELPGNAFELQPPPGARSVTLKEKGSANTTPVL
jgi:hypothetical protein